MLPGNEMLNTDNDNSSMRFYSVAELSQILPEILQSSAVVNHSYENRHVLTYELDSYYQQQFNSQSDYMSVHHPTRTDKMSSGFNMTYNPNTQTVIAVYPSEFDKADKTSTYKNYEIIETTPNEEIIKQQKVSFDYPRAFKEQQTVFDINDPKKSLGQVIFFERLNVGKSADPSKANMQIVYIPNEGEILSSLIKFRPDNKGWQKIHGVFGDGESLFISFHSFGADGAFFGIKKISPDGKSVDFKYSKELLKENTIITTGNFGELNRSRKTLGPLAEDPAFRWGTEDFALQGVQKTDTKLYLWGKAKYHVVDFNNKVDGLVSPIPYYAESFVFVYDNASMNFEKMYMINSPIEKNETAFRLINKNADEIELFIPVKSADQKDYSKTVVTTNLENKARYGEDYKYLMSPLFVTINGDNARFQYYKDVYTLDLDNGYIKCKDGSKIIVGFDAYAGKERDDSGIFSYRNKHFFHFVPVNY
jgi:hypothetical protein